MVYSVMQMNFREYVMGLAKPERKIFAEKCGVSLGHLHNVAYGYKPCTAELAIAVEQHSAGALTCEIMVPQINWAYLRRPVEAESSQ